MTSNIKCIALTYFGCAKTIFGSHVCELREVPEESYITDS